MNPQARQVMPVPGMGLLSKNPTLEEARALIKRGFSYVRTLDLSTATTGKGALLEGAGYGLNLMLRSPLNTALALRFNDDGQTIRMYPGTEHRVGDVFLNHLRGAARNNAGRAPTSFAHFYAEVIDSGDETGTAYFLVYGTPETVFREEPSQVPVSLSETNAAVGAALENIFTATRLRGKLVNGRIYVRNTGDTNPLESVQVEISPDGTNWEEILVNNFDALAAETLRSAELPAGIDYIRVRGAADTGNSTTSTVWIVGKRSN